MKDPNQLKKQVATSRRKILFLLKRHNVTKIEDINSHTDRELAEIEDKRLVETGHDWVLPE